MVVGSVGIFIQVTNQITLKTARPIMLAGEHTSPSELSPMSSMTSSASLERESVAES